MLDSVLCAIRERALAGEDTQDLADEFGISRGRVYAIKKNENCRSHPLPPGEPRQDGAPLPYFRADE